jgi:hypothetical protein
MSFGCCLQSQGFVKFCAIIVLDGYALFGCFGSLIFKTSLTVFSFKNKKIRNNFVKQFY